MIAGFLHDWAPVPKALFVVAYVVFWALLLWKVGYPLAKWWVKDRRRVLAVWVLAEALSIWGLVDRDDPVWPLWFQWFMVVFYGVFVVVTARAIRTRGHRWK